MAATADQCAALAKDPNFVARVLALAMQFATGTVYVESTGVPNHAIRLAYARSIIAGNGGGIVSTIANSGNIIASNITYDFTDAHIKTDATDGAISSQISTYWNMLAGV